ncbi:MAG TPA: GNAT family N-acetyltransferase [Thermoanaerobaculia bacterium]
MKSVDEQPLSGGASSNSSENFDETESLCFGLFEDGRQIGFARVITDAATFAYLADVYVLGSHRGRGLATWLMECILAHPGLAGLRRWMLVTRDAHALYRKVGFRELAHPERIMEMTFPGIYE